MKMNIVYTGKLKTEKKMKQRSIILAISLVILFTECTPGKPAQGNAEA
mgnify:FL=1